jgi:hypothetical protein
MPKKILVIDDAPYVQQFTNALTEVLGLIQFAPYVNEYLATGVPSVS